MAFFKIISCATCFKGGNGAQHSIVIECDFVCQCVVQV